MDMNPQRVRSAEFKTVRKGADQHEVRVFLNDVADELERAQNQATAMEARARAAVARLQEVTESEAAAPKLEASAEEAETISRTLLLAQRTADSTIADSQSEAARIVAQAKNEAAATLDSTREMSAQLIAEARIEARRTAEAEHQSILSEVEALKARRDFLEADVHHLETFLVDQRSRVREAATALLQLTDRVPGGLGDVRSPLLSASDDDTGEIVVEEPDLLIVADAADDEGDAVDDMLAGDPVAEVVVVDEVESASADALDTEAWRSDEPTEAIPVFRDDADDTPNDADDFTFSFDDERS
jgi:DivIVA domain-containing protein